MNGKWCVRCGKTDPTPYLKNAFTRFLNSTDREMPVIDVGCGNGRNSKFMAAEGFTTVIPLDMACAQGSGCLTTVLGKDDFPVLDSQAGIILANYILMFLDNMELSKTMDEIDRVAAPGCFLVIELYAAKDCNYKTPEDIAWLNKACSKWLQEHGWEKLRLSKDKSIHIKLKDSDEETK